jgi:hypothetical protein
LCIGLPPIDVLLILPLASTYRAGVTLDDQTTWHELIEHLTSSQVCELMRSDHQPSCGPHDTHRLRQLRVAENHAAQNDLQVLYASVPLPPGATSASEWDFRDRRCGRVWRHFTGTRRGTTATVGIDGMQNSDGSVAERQISIICGNGELTATTAREVAADLIAAADELDQLEKNSSPRSDEVGTPRLRSRSVS